MTFAGNIEKKGALAQAKEFMAADCNESAKKVSNYLEAKAKSEFSKMHDVNVAATINGGKTRFELLINEPTGEGRDLAISSLCSHLLDIFKSKNVSVRPTSSHYGMIVEGTIGDIMSQIKRNDKSGWAQAKSAKSASSHL